MSGAYDRGKLVELFGNDPATLADVEREFLETVQEAAREIAGSDDFTAIARAAHRLKGASGMIGAETLQRIAETIEVAAIARDLGGVRRVQADFEREVLRVGEQAASDVG